MAAAAFAATNFFADNRIFAADKNSTVRTRYGTYNGFVKRGVRTWLGIPYAKAPVGNLRWRPPEKLEPSNKIFDAKKFGYSPVQDRDDTEAASFLPQSEDCLTLNIWSPATDGAKPVMVFIPGGGFVNGGSGDPLYNGANLAAAGDVCVVTINYRLNIFGFMNFAAIDPAYESTGYLGLMDQVAALEWVRENIVNFGGDPVNVTVFGESAGAGSTLLLSVAPAAQGLFQKAIAQSGTLSFYHAPDQSAQFAVEFMEFGDCKNMDELRKKSTDELKATYEKFLAVRMFSADVDYFPTCDGKFLPVHPFRALKDGAARGIKFLTGTTAEEYCYWNLYDKNFTKQLPEFHDALTPIVYEGEFFDVEQIYQHWQKNHMELADDERYLEFSNQLDWRVGQELTAEYQSAFDDVFFYLFSQASPVKELGSCHAIDLPFVFNNPSEKIEPKPSPELVNQVQAAWTMFAKTGNPGNKLIPTWKKYSAHDRQTMEINAAGWTCHRDLNTQNLNELRRIYEEHLLD